MAYGYGKRPLWQWIVIYLIFAIIVYGGIYYFFLRKNGYSHTNAVKHSSQTQSAAAPSDNIYLTKTDSAKGTYLTDFAGMTLYVSGNDTPGVSNCTGSCVSVWPPYTSGAVSQKTFPQNITVITRSDGTKQFAWKGMPLYYFSNDTQKGQLSGDGVNGFHIAK